MELIELIFEITLSLILIVIAVGDIIGLIMFFKCFKKARCDNGNCHLRHFCYKYQMTITQEDLDQLDELLNEKRKELEKKEQD